MEEKLFFLIHLGIIISCVLSSVILVNVLIKALFAARKREKATSKLLARKFEVAHLGRVWVEGVLHELPHELYLKVLLIHKMRLEGRDFEFDWLLEYPGVSILGYSDDCTLFKPEMINLEIAVQSYRDTVIEDMIRRTEVSFCFPGTFGTEKEWKDWKEDEEPSKSLGGGWHGRQLDDDD